MHTHRITSKQNTIYKELKKLSFSKHRKLERKFLVEGIRESTLALNSKFVDIEMVVFCEEILSKSGFDLGTIFKEFPALKYLELSSELYNEIAFRENAEGLILLALEKDVDPVFDENSLVKDAIYFAFDGVEKPGNIGAFLRTADALGVKAIFILTESYDLFNPNTVRSSLGTLFTLPVYVLTHENFIKIFEKDRADVIVAKIEDNAKDISEFVPGSKPCVVIMGSEANGVSNFWSKFSFVKACMIPMVGKVNSMNVSVAAAIFAYSLFQAKKR